MKIPATIILSTGNGAIKPVSALCATCADAFITGSVSSLQHQPAAAAVALLLQQPNTNTNFFGITTNSGDEHFLLGWLTACVHGLEVTDQVPTAAYGLELLYAVQVLQTPKVRHRFLTVAC